MECAKKSGFVTGCRCKWALVPAAVGVNTWVMALADAHGRAASTNSAETKRSSDADRDATHSFINTG